MLNLIKRIFNAKSIAIGIVLMMYFMVMDNLGYSDVIELRLFNGVIMGAGLWLVLSKYTDKDEASYFKSLWRGVETSAGASIFFAFTFWIYVLFANPEFIPNMQEIGVFPEQFEAYQASVMIIFEGLASGAVMSFMWMQYFRTKIPRDTVDSKSTSGYESVAS